MKFRFALIYFFVVLSDAAAQQSYNPPVFTDADRLKKIASTYKLVDKLFETQAARAHYPGLVWGLVVDGKLVHTGSMGYTDIAKKTRATSKSVFRIASMTKSFTTMAIVKLRDQGRLNLDDPAHKYIPELKKVKYLATDARPITVRDLMTHAAGFPEDNPWGDRQLADTEAELTKLIEGGLSFSNVPGIAYEYSNLGFAMLGRIITNVTKQPYDRYITENILRPLGMNSTYWEYTKVPPSLLAHGYRWINNNWSEEELLHHGSHSSMGGLMTSIEDFARYLAFHQSAWPPKSGSDNGPVRRSSLREMHHPWNVPSLNSNYRYPSGRLCATVSSYAYGLGWSKDCQERVMVGHSGGLPGFGSQWRFLPEYGIGIISFANRTYAGTGTVNTQVLDTIIALAQLRPATLPASSILKQRTKELVQILPDWNNAGRTKIFAENFFADYIIDSLRKEAKTIFDKAGRVLSVDEIVPENQLRGTFTIRAEKGNIRVFFTLTPEVPALVQEYAIRFVPNGQ